MNEISLCMIVRDEEKNLAHCLSGVSDIVDEIIIVDTGSRDGTKEIAKQYTDQIYDFTWSDDFSAARNFSFSKATKDYILWLDADDVLLPEDAQKFRNLKRQMNPEVDVVIMRYHIGQDKNGNSIGSFPRERLLKRSKQFRWHDRVHEYLVLTGTIINVDIGITHRSTHGISTRNLKILEKILEEEKTLTHRQTFYYARELFLNEQFERAEQYYREFLEEEGGLTSNYLDACFDLANCRKRQNDRLGQQEALLKSFSYAAPKAEVCCKMGQYYQEEDQYERAIEWYEVAIQLKKPEGNTSSIIHEFWGYIPCMELCICNFKLQRYEAAKRYNEMAGYYRPDDCVYLHNRDVIETILKTKPCARESCEAFLR